MKIRFVGAVGTVTGSCTLLEHNGEYFLVDCGAGQDSVANSSTVLDFKPAAVRSLFLTHAHLDHCGLIPALIAQGFTGRIHCTAATRDLTLNSLQDSSRLGQCSAEHIPAPDRFNCPDVHPDFAWGKYLYVTEDLTFAMSRSSHVLGAVSFSFQFLDPSPDEPSRRTTICFSGDVGCNTAGNCYQPLLAKRLTPDHYTSFLVLESTYGDRNRSEDTTSFDTRMDGLQTVLEQSLTLSCEPRILIPCFSLHRTQELLADLHCLVSRHLDPEIKAAWSARLNRDSNDDTPLVDIAIESPLAWKHSAVYRRELPRLLNTNKRKPLYLNPEFADRSCADGTSADELLTTLLTEPMWQQVQLGDLRLGKDGERLNPQSIRIIIAGSGMCQGGRILEHLRTGLADPEVLVVLMGFQARGTPGAELRKRVADPTAPVALREWNLPDDVRATITDLGRFYSGHADGAGLINYALEKDNLNYSFMPLRRIFLNHGEAKSREALKAALLARASESREGDRSLGTVELPGRDSGWFDLKRDTWMEDIDDTVDGNGAVIAMLRRRVARLESEVADLKATHRSASACCVG